MSVANCINRIKTESTSRAHINPHNFLHTELYCKKNVSEDHHSFRRPLCHWEAADTKAWADQNKGSGRSTALHRFHDLQEMIVHTACSGVIDASECKMSSAFIISFLH